MARFFLTSFLFLPLAKVAELSMPKLSESISMVSVVGSKFVILSADFFLNCDGNVNTLLKTSCVEVGDGATGVDSVVGPVNGVS